MLQPHPAFSKHADLWNEVFSSSTQHPIGTISSSYGTDFSAKYFFSLDPSSPTLLSEGPNWQVFKALRRDPPSFVIVCRVDRTNLDSIERERSDSHFRTLMTLHHSNILSPVEFKCSDPLRNYFIMESLPRVHFLARKNLSSEDYVSQRLLSCPRRPILGMVSRPLIRRTRPRRQERSIILPLRTTDTPTPPSDNRVSHLLAITSALYYLYSNGLVHSSITPSAIYVDPLTHRLKIPPPLFPSSLSCSHSLHPSPGYLFSLGTTLATLITGRTILSVEEFLHEIDRVVESNGEISIGGIGIGIGIRNGNGKRIEIISKLLGVGEGGYGGDDDDDEVDLGQIFVELLRDEDDNDNDNDNGVRVLSGKGDHDDVGVRFVVEREREREMIGSLREPMLIDQNDVGEEENNLKERMKECCCDQTEIVCPKCCPCCCCPLWIQGIGLLLYALCLISAGITGVGLGLFVGSRAGSENGVVGAVVVAVFGVLCIALSFAAIIGWSGLVWCWAYFNFNWFA